MPNKIDISGIGKAELLVWLYAYSQPPSGIAALNFGPDVELTVDAAREILRGKTSATPYKGQPMFVDYVLGRKLHIDLVGDETDPAQYDKANGEGMAARVIAAIRIIVDEAGSQVPQCPEVAKLQAYAVREVAQTRLLIGQGSQAELDEAQVAYESATLPGNRNAFVPWDDPQIPFECDCGEIIYADTEHSH